MVDKAIAFLGQQINDHLRIVLDPNATEDKILLTNLVDQNGKLLLGAGSLGLTLVHIEEEFTIQPNRALVQMSENTLGAQSPSLFLNLYLLISANFTEYKSALKYLTQVIKFFQMNTSFEKENSPELESIGIDNLTIRIHKNSIEQQNQLWGTLGAKYMPSIVYKMAVIEVQEGQTKFNVPQVESLNLNMTKV